MPLQQTKLENILRTKSNFHGRIFLFPHNVLFQLFRNYASKSLDVALFDQCVPLSWNRVIHSTMKGMAASEMHF